ncbi:MAG: hypothetical protein DSY60_01120 [Persephonella sp.]|nr:MAG: hypothetical protein DSY60_01120 [Persephonella sp.]
MNTTLKIFAIINFYRELIEKIEKEELNPFEMSSEELSEELKELIGDNFIINGIVISLLSKLLKLKVEYLGKQLIQIEEEKEERLKDVFKQVLKEETNLEDDDIEALLMIDSIKEKLKKPKSIKPKKISYKEFQKITKGEIKNSLHKIIDYNKYALEVAKEVENGTFKIKNIKDFIGSLFAIHLFNIEVKDIKKFL